MSVIESLFYMMWRGFAIGVIISAPMGPVGILCIQRTLEKGRKAGLYTGIGAALSDLLYCLLTGFGLSFIEEFIERNQNIIQLFGSVVLVAFAAYLIKKTPSSSLLRPVPAGVSAKKNILGGFLFTFSNPLILFLTIGLFARFNFLMPDIKFYHYMLGFLFILVGALAWWYGVTYVVDKIRSRFSFKTMKKINFGIAVVILLFALVGIVSATSNLVEGHAGRYDPSSPRQLVDKNRRVRHFNSRRGYDGFSVSCGSPGNTAYNRGYGDITPDTAGGSFILENMNEAPVFFMTDTDLRSPSDRLDLTFTLRNLRALNGCNAGGKLPAWGLMIGDTAIMVRNIIGKDDIYDSQVHTEIDGCPAGEGFDVSDSPNRFRLILTDGLLTLAGGRRGDVMLVRKRLAGADMPRRIGFRLDAGAKVSVSDITLAIDHSPGYGEASSRFAGVRELCEYLTAPEDDMEGIWDIFDYSYNQPRAASGGRYRLAFVACEDNPGLYEILYIGGAAVGSDIWRPMMLKGLLRSTSAPGVYAVEWIDAEGNVVVSEAVAQREADYLTIQFPRLSSALRLRKTEVAREL